MVVPFIEMGQIKGGVYLVGKKMKSSVLVILGLRCLGPSKWKCCNGSNGAP